MEPFLIGKAVDISEETKEDIINELKDEIKTYCYDLKIQDISIECVSNELCTYESDLSGNPKLYGIKLKLRSQ